MADAASVDPQVRQSAILLLALDDERAAKVLQHLPVIDVELISHEMSHIGKVSHDDLAEALHAFQAEVDQYAELGAGTSDRLGNMLRKALGDERAARVLDGIVDNDGDHSGIDVLNEMEARAVSEMIREEHPQIIATILVHLDRKQAAAVLEQFEPDLRNDVVYRIATFSGVQPAALEELTSALGNMLSGQNVRRSKMGGPHTAAEILNLMDSQQSETSVEDVRTHDSDLAQEIVDEMFLFENLADMDDVSMQRLVKDLDSNTLRVALRGIPNALAEKFFRCMPTRQAQLLREDMESSGPVRVSQVEKERKAILAIARKLADEGEISLSGSNDSYV
ncbi:MAG TPA: flagellar motor switch protein FliG [Nevskiaceae bacterium]|nr:flagellar motor switch protein FliG [Nevskiaceae bacterium]